MNFLMAGSTREQRNAYKGSPTRAWIRVALVARDGTAQALELLADTGCPFPVIVSIACMNQMKHFNDPGANSSVGRLEGGWVRLVVPAIGFDRLMIGYASDSVAASAQSSCPDFQGLAGLPLLRMMEYGGNSYCFWIRPALGVP
jgi:hypothetical protein